MRPENVPPQMDPKWVNVGGINVAEVDAQLRATYKSDPRSVAWIAAGPLLFVLSLIPLWYRAHVSALGVSNSDYGNAWHGPLPILAVLAALSASVLLLLSLLQRLPRTLPSDTIAAVLFTVAFVFFALGLFVLPGAYGDVNDAGGFGALSGGTTDIGASSFILAWLAVPISGAAAYFVGMPLLRSRRGS
jgi:hypothetical protein